MVACATPECTEQVLTAAKVEFGIVPAVWTRQSDGSVELTLTLIEATGRTINVDGTVAEADPLVEQALVIHARKPTLAGPVAMAAAKTQDEENKGYWKAGPILLIVGGVSAALVVGIKAAQTGCIERQAGICVAEEKLNTGAAIALSAIGAAAIGGGIAWWVVGAKRRKEKQMNLAISPSQVHFRLQY